MSEFSSGAGSRICVGVLYPLLYIIVHLLVSICFMFPLDFPYIPLRKVEHRILRCKTRNKLWIDFFLKLM